MYHSIFTHSSTDGPLVGLQSLAIVNSAAMDIGVHIFFFYIGILGFLGFNPRSGNTGSKSILFLIFLRILHTVSHSGCIRVHSHPQCRRVPFSPHPRQHLLFVDL